MANLLSTLSGAEVPGDSSGEQSHAEKWGRIGKVTSRGGTEDHRPRRHKLTVEQSNAARIRASSAHPPTRQ